MAEFSAPYGALDRIRTAGIPDDEAARVRALIAEFNSGPQLPSPVPNSAIRTE